MADATKQPFPRTFYYANAIELLERLAHYGVYIGLALYLSNVVNMSDVQVGWVLGNFRFVGSMAPIPCGSIADRIGFKRSLIIAFIGYAVGYTCLLLFPAKLPAILSLALIAVSGGFLKPVITGTVVRTSPPGREAEGLRHLLPDGEFGERRRQDARVSRSQLRRAASRGGDVSRG